MRDPHNFAALVLPLFLGGCMMAGMGMMGPMRSGKHGRDGPTVIKEVVGGGLRVTAEFPAYTPGDSLRYTVTIFDIDAQVLIPEASVVLIASPVTGTSEASGSPSSHVHADSPPPTDRQRRVEVQRMTAVADGRHSGSFVFRPSLPRDGPYRLTVLVDRAGSRAIDPPLVLDQVVQLQVTGVQPSDLAHEAHGARLTPFVVLGTGLMAIMMMFSFR